MIFTHKNADNLTRDMEFQKQTTRKNIFKVGKPQSYK